MYSCVQIEQFQSVKNRATGERQPYMFVTFVTEESAEICVEKSNHHIGSAKVLYVCVLRYGHMYACHQYERVGVACLGMNLGIISRNYLSY